MSIGTAWADATVVGYTEAINGTNLDARVLSVGGLANLTISDPIFGSAITDQGSKTVYIDNVAYTNNKSWRKSVKDTYENQNVGYQLTVGAGYKMNISKVNARIAVADDTYTWYVEILNSAGTQVWKSGERTTKKDSSGKIDNVDVTDKKDVQGLTGTITVNLWVKQGGSTKYFSINYLQLAVELEEDARPNYTITANVADGQEAFGSIDKAGDNSVPEGDAISLTATANPGYGFISWTKDDVEVSTSATLTLSDVSANATYVANFKKLYRATYSLGEYAGTITGKVLCSFNAGSSINEIYADIDDNYTIPAYADKYLYREGYAFAGWSYGGNVYKSGDVISGLTENPTITPTWEATTQTLANATAATAVTWSLAKADLVFMDWQSNDKYGYYTQTATVNGEKIAIPMQITKGKVGNYTRTDALAQTNQNTTFTIPAVSGMTITIPDAYKEFSTTTIAGSTEYTGSGTKTISYTYTGSAETIDIVIGESGQYLTSIEVTYPVPTSVSATIGDAGYATFSNASEVTVPEGVTAYTAVVKDESTISLIPIDGGVIPAGEGVVLEAAEGNYNLNITTTGAAKIGGNLLKAQLTKGTPEDAIYYTLAAGPTFKKSSGGTLAAGKAYLVLPAAESRGSFNVTFGDATGISEVNAAQEDGALYNLNGIRVAKATKGLYIQNGKKVIVK